DSASIVRDTAYGSGEDFWADLPERIRPLTRLSFFLDRLAFGLEPAGYHLQNLLLHTGCGLLLYSIIARARLGPPGLAFWSALFFLVHPIACETVTYVSGRASGLSAFLLLLALALYTRATPGTDGSAIRPLTYAAALAAFALALGAKETAAALPLLLLAWDAIVRRAAAGAPRDWYFRNHLPFWGVLAVAILAALLLVPRYRELAAFSLALRAPWENLWVQCKPLAFALVLYARPAWLNVDHALAPAPLSDPLAWVAAGALAALLTTAILIARRLPAVTLGVIWFFVTALPANGPIARSDLLSERNLYLPCMGLAIAAAGLLCALIAAWPKPTQAWAGLAFRVAALGMVAYLGSATVQRNSLWASPLALWTDAVTKSPLNSRAHNNLGFALERQGDLDGAIREYRRALDLDANDAQAGRNLQRAWAAAARR
ncbi:MAG TPA: tetratricopeptide repeat protein, partial [Burkholderiaceae bacterium]|nr:tetratricopeptide repeat protein [Burkholderiaceae bacterium]